jgi:hypothetical protein
MEKIFGPFNKKTFKIDLDVMETLILWNFFLGPFNSIISRFDCNQRFRLARIILAFAVITPLYVRVLFELQNPDFHA